MGQMNFDLPPGRTLGRHYHVVEFLGSGWEGEVYRVRERRTGIERAAKLFFAKRNVRGTALLRYAHKLNKLRHCPIVVQYHHRDTVSVRGETVEFLVSDLIEGEVLSQFIESQPRKRLEPFQALHLFYALVWGVEQVHYQGEYHGDIHSYNVMVSRRGLGFDVHLLDFFNLGRSTRERIQQDVFDLIAVLHEMIGGDAGYRRAGNEIRQIVLGRKHTLIRKRFRDAGDLRLALDNLEW